MKTVVLVVPDETPREHEGTLPSVRRQDIASLDWSVDAFVLDPNCDPDPWKSLGAVRQHPRPDIYLRPMFVAESAESELRAASDGIWTFEDGIGAEEKRIDQINDKARNYFESVSDHSLGLRILRFAATRGIDFEPTRTTSMLQGFKYSPLEPLDPNATEGTLNTLELLEDQKLLSGRLVTRSYACFSCRCHFLNFCEVCPHCDSVDIAGQDLVHHFRCGFTAGFEEFSTENGLVCPKCRHALGNIGVDYDKPSTMHECRNCRHDFQEPNVVATCFSCGYAAEPENQVIRDIKVYTITALGLEAAALGLENIFLNSMDEAVRLCPWSSFSQFLEVESSRIGRYKKSESTLLLIHLRGLADIHARLGRRSRELFREIAEHFRALVRHSDVVTARSETVLAVMLTETTEDEAQVAVQRLRTRLRDAIEENLDVGIEVVAETTPIVPNLDLSGRVDEFVDQHVS